MSQTKIVATIGPATNSREALEALHDAGMNIARLNGSHNSLDWHKATISLIREALPDTPILLDIPGRKIRTGRLAHEPVFDVGDELILTTDQSHDGTLKVPVNYSDLHVDLFQGATILADDGTLRFQVINVIGKDIHCRAETAGQLKSAKGINVPFVHLNTAQVTSRDHAMLKFARENGVDFVGISFVESADHIAAIRDIINDSWPRIVSKIENQNSLDNMEEVIDATDIIMIDRGDLSVETNLESVTIFQKQILSTSATYGKPVIVATEMLHTMIYNPYPTKAEISDISNAVLDGASATMLSGETAVGANPVEAVSVMRRVNTITENHLHDKVDTNSAKGDSSIPQVMGQAVALICRSLPITKIVAVTISGFAARTVAAQRPRQKILAISNDPIAARSFNILPGTTGVYVDTPFYKSDMNHISICLQSLWQRKFINEEDNLLVTAVAYPKSGNRMNLIQTHRVDDLAKALNWF